MSALNGDAPGLPAAASTEAGDLLAGKLPEVIERAERELIRRALEASGGDWAQSAAQLGIRRQLLYQKLARYGTAHVPEEDSNAPTQRPESAATQ